MFYLISLTRKIANYFSLHEMDAILFSPPLFFVLPPTLKNLNQQPFSLLRGKDLREETLPYLREILSENDYQTAYCFADKEGKADTFLIIQNLLIVPIYYS